MTHGIRDNPRTVGYPRDLFRCGVSWPNEVVILGTGPNGKAAWPRITAKHCIIALNKAIMYCGFDGIPFAAYWLCTTPWYFRNAAWWEEAMSYSVVQGASRIFGWALADMVEHPPESQTQRWYQDNALYREPWVPGADYTIYALTNWNEEFRKGETEYPPCTLIPGMVRGGGTIAGHAIQIAAQICNPYRVLADWGDQGTLSERFPPKIILVGVDMKGSGYADGTVNDQVDAKYKDDGFTELPLLQSMVDVIGQDCEIVSWSETALEVKCEY